MKKKWIVAFIAAGVLLLGGVTVYAVKTSSQSTVKVVSVSDMSGGRRMAQTTVCQEILLQMYHRIFIWQIHRQ